MSYSNYALCHRDDRFWLIGPFATHAGVAEWCRDPMNNPEEDPRWQNIRLPDALMVHLGDLPVFPPRATFDELAVAARYRPELYAATDACSLSPTTADTMASTAQASASVAAITSGLPRPEDDCPVKIEGYRDEIYWFVDAGGRTKGYLAEHLCDSATLSQLFGGDSSWLIRHFPAEASRRRSAARWYYLPSFHPVLAAAWLIRRCEEAGTPPS